MKNLKFATKLLIVILSISIVSMIAVAMISYTALLNLSGYSQDVNVQLGFYASDNSKEALIEQAESYMIRLAAAQANECNETLAMIQSNVIAMSAFMESLYENPDNFEGRVLPLPNEVPSDIPLPKMMVAPNVEITPDIQSEMLLISNAEYMFSSVHAANENMSNAYLGSASGINFRWSESNAHDPGYDPRQRPWYLTAVDSDGPVWLDTYIDPFGFVMATCAGAYSDPLGNIAGVVATDIHLSTMIENILNFRIGVTGFAFLLDHNGNYMAHPRYNTYNPDVLVTDNEGYTDIIMSMASGETNVRSSVIDETEFYIAYAPLSITGWSLGIVVELNEIISGALLIKTDIDNQAFEVREQIRLMLNSVMFRFIVLTCVIIILVLILSILISGSVTKPIVKLTRGVIEVGKGNLESKIDIDSGDEMGVLAESFNKMTDELAEYIANLSRVTAEKERIGAELDVAAKIQASMLPCIFPPYPERPEFDIFASMLPAKEVGGDFYDFFFINEGTFAVVMADVSDKGVPAALFMVVAKTLIKNNAQAGKSPKEVFETVNNMLCENNEAGMFVTAFLGYLDVSDGSFTFVNAGHNPPLLLTGGRQFDWLKTKPGFVLAGMEGIVYRESEITLEQGDELFLYTDGITEAMNDSGKFYGEPRLLEMANGHKGFPPESFALAIKSDIDKFSNGAKQADDITMLTLRYNGLTGARSTKKEGHFEAKLANMDAVMEFVDAQLAGLAHKTLNQIRIAVDEIFSNIARYAYSPGIGSATVRITVDDYVTIEFEDSGVAYDPLSAADPDITLPASERKIGGLGILMVKNIMDSVEYRRKGSKNILTMKKRYAAANA